MNFNANIIPINLCTLLTVNLYSLLSTSQSTSSTHCTDRVPEKVSVPFSAWISSKQIELNERLEFPAVDLEAVSTETTGR